MLKPRPDAIIGDIEPVVSDQELSREQFLSKLHGGSVAEPLFIIDCNAELGKPSKSTAPNWGAVYSLPRSAEQLRIDARFVLAIWTGEMFQRPNNYRFGETANYILIEMGGGADPLDSATHPIVR